MIYELKTKDLLSITPISNVYEADALMDITCKNILNKDDKVYFLNSTTDKEYRKTFEIATTPKNADKLILDFGSNKKSAYVTMADVGHLLSVEDSKKLITHSVWETALKMKELLDNDPQPRFLILNNDNCKSRYERLSGFNCSISEITYSETIIFKFADSIDINKIISEDVYFAMHDAFDKSMTDSIVEMLNSNDKSVFAVGEKMLLQYRRNKLKDIIYILSKWHKPYYGDFKKIEKFIRNLGIDSNYNGRITEEDALIVVNKFNPPDAQEIMSMFDVKLKGGWVQKIVKDETVDTSN